VSHDTLLLEMPGGGRVLFGERTHGNASSVGGEGSEDGARVRERLCELAGLRALARGYQVHGSEVRRVRVPPRPEDAAQPDERADGQATALRLVGATVLTADCLPIALGGDGAVAMVPGAGVCCYEVGEEVHDAFAPEHRHGRNIDLRAIAREQLLAAGVREVLDLDLCTICDERFFSHRREGESAGRQAAIAWLS
jgi:copper oxidase (laccase) domain-containing protein